MLICCDVAAIYAMMPCFYVMRFAADAAAAVTPIYAADAADAFIISMLLMPTLFSC